MKSVLGNQQFSKCNFCLQWYKSADNGILVPLSICQNCFERCRRSAYFRLLQPKSFTLYQVGLRRCVTTQIDTIVQGQTNELLDLTDLYEAKGGINGSTLEQLKHFLTELVASENDILNRLEPTRQFLNGIYKTELQRIEKVWDGVLMEIEEVGARLTDYRKQVTQQLRHFSCDVHISQQVLNQTKEELQRKLECFAVERLKKKFKENPEQFYKNAFKLSSFGELIRPLTERNTSRSNLFIQPLNLEPSRKEIKNNMKNIRQRARGALTSRNEVGDKQNIEYLHTDPNVSQLQVSALVFNNKSPRMNRTKSSTSQQPFFAGRPKKDKSVDSSAVQEEDKEKAKHQILELLKKKPLKMVSQKIMKETIYEALQRTFCSNNLIELVAYKAQDLQFPCYLEMLNWHQEDLEIVKMVKVGLTDEQLAMLLPYLTKCRKLSTLVITNNQLTDFALQILCTYFADRPAISNIYLGRNYIQPLRCKNRLRQLRQMNVHVYI